MMESRKNPVEVRKMLCCSIFIMVWTTGCLTSPSKGMRSSAKEITANATTTRTTGTVYALLVGVNKYKDNAWKPFLKYAENDAKEISHALTRFGRILQENIIVLTGEQAERASILRELDNLNKKATEEDTILIMFAGHGDVYDGVSYLAAHDTVRSKLRSTGLRAHDLTEGSKTKRVLLLLDACHSGVPLPSGRTPGEIPNSRGKAIPFSGQGLAVLASSKQHQFSWENDKLKQGLFSYALKEALAGEADDDKDGIVTLLEMYTYVSKKVPSLAKELKHPAQEPVLTGAISGIIPVSYPLGYGVLRLSSNLSGVLVYIDGEQRRSLEGKPIQLKLLKGSHTVVFKKQGYKPKTKQIVLSGGRLLPVEGNLEKEINNLDASVSGERYPSVSVSNWTPWSGTAIGLGSTAVATGVILHTYIGTRSAVGTTEYQQINTGAIALYVSGGVALFGGILLAIFNPAHQPGGSPNKYKNNTSGTIFFPKSHDSIFLNKIF